MALHVPKHLQRSRTKDEESAMESAIALLGVLAEEMDRPDLGDVSMLDVGCGVKFSQALIEEDLPIGRYTGIDVYEPLITHLAAENTDPRFRYHHVDFFNGRYNPTGTPMTADSVLPLGDETFDLICGFSLFTHLDPTDFGIMLGLMGRHAHPDTRLVFTAFIDEHTEGGHGLIDRYSEASGTDVSTGEAFRDFWPDDVLRVALYSRPHIGELIDASPWKVRSIKDPTPYAQHLITLVPA
ncbi:MAG: class I SAM-dependent methyltransferase [Actinobacteria bacterium]|nr:class I SAM-dependent methyltransferase [Actinomycetota bacterium]